MRAVQQVDLAFAIQTIGVVTNGAVFFIAGFELVHNWLPELVKFFLVFGLIETFLAGLLPALIPDSSHIRNKRFEEFLSVFDGLVNTVYGSQDLLPFLGHHGQVFLAYPGELVANKAFLDILVLRDIPTVLHPLIEMIPREEASRQGLHCQDAIQ